MDTGNSTTTMKEPTSGTKNASKDKGESICADEALELCPCKEICFGKQVAADWN